MNLVVYSVRKRLQMSRKRLREDRCSHNVPRPGLFRFVYGGNTLRTSLPFWFRFSVRFPVLKTVLRVSSHKLKWTLFLLLVRLSILKQNHLDWQKFILHIVYETGQTYHYITFNLLNEFPVTNTKLDTFCREVT